MNEKAIPTPGPWVYDEKRRKVYSHAIVGDLRLVADNVSPNDGQIIAAASELIEAHEALDNATELVRGALAKAHGELT